MPLIGDGQTGPHPKWAEMAVAAGLKCDWSVVWVSVPSKIFRDRIVVASSVVHITALTLNFWRRVIHSRDLQLSMPKKELHLEHRYRGRRKKKKLEKGWSTLFASIKFNFLTLSYYRLVTISSKSSISKSWIHF